MIKEVIGFNLVPNGIATSNQWIPIPQLTLKDISYAVGRLNLIFVAKSPTELCQATQTILNQINILSQKQRSLISVEQNDNNQLEVKIEMELERFEFNARLLYAIGNDNEVSIGFQILQ